MGDNINYSKLFFDISASKAKKATEYMGNAVTNSVSAINSIPNDFNDSVNARDSINNIKNICLTGPDINSTYFDLGLMLEDIEGDSPGNFSFDFGDDLYYINWNEDCYVNVTRGEEDYDDGVKYAIDKYVLGVLDGESQVRTWGRLAYDGEISNEVFYTCCKAFSVMARSYGIAQTEFNFTKGRNENLKISDNNKQIFNTRLFDFSDPENDFQKGWSLYSGIAASAVIETTGMVIGNNSQPISTYYNNDQGQCKDILEYAKQGYDYITILKKLYPDNYVEGGCDLKYFDYKDKTIIGNVPKDTEISELIGLNLTTEKPNSGPTEWTYQLTDKGRKVGVMNEAANNGEAFISEVNYNDSTLPQTGRIFLPPTDSTATQTPPVDATSKPGDPFPGISDEELARRVWNEEFGAGAERKNNLGIRYNAVQDLVNKGVGKPGTQTPSTTETPKPAEPKAEDPEVGLNIEDDEDKVPETDKQEPDVKDDTDKPPVANEDDDPPYNPPSHSDPTPAPVEPSPAPTYILPENKFSELIPNITNGNLDSMEISVVHANYDLSGISDEVYNNYLNTLKQSGYTLGNDGITWMKDNYTLNLIRNNTDLNIYFKVN